MVEAHIFQDIRWRGEIAQVRQVRTHAKLPDVTSAYLKALEDQKVIDAYPAAMDTIKEVFFTANGARLVASRTIAPLIEPTINMLLAGERKGVSNNQDEEMYRTVIAIFVDAARRELLADTERWDVDQANGLIDMDSAS